MPLKLNVELTEEQRSTLATIPATSWFTQVVYRNVSSPAHPHRELIENNEMKIAMVQDWIARAVPGRRVLDLFCANGAFSVMAAQAGAKEVVGLDFAEERIHCAKFVAGTIQADCSMEFRHGDVYRIGEYFKEPFDVVLCFGGLYHIADPAFLLRQIRSLTKERLIMQTSSVLPYPGNWAKFVVRVDKTAEGLTSIRGGNGVWYYTAECVRALLRHGGFSVTEEQRPPWSKRRRFPWYLAYCAPL